LFLVIKCSRWLRFSRAERVLVLQHHLEYYFPKRLAPHWIMRTLTGPPSTCTRCGLWLCCIVLFFCFFVC
jgi:hypothetical protein